MEGNGPAWGTAVKTDLIIAGTNPLATDMVAANVMGFEPSQVPTFTRANQIGMSPASMGEIEIRGEALDAVRGIATRDGKRRPFAKPGITRWADVASWWAAEELVGTEDTAVPGSSWGEIKAKSR